MVISSAVVAELLAHAREEVPRECCGLLIGNGVAIERSVRGRNTAEEPTRRFLIDPADHFAAIRSARADALEVVGAYHSHPSTEPVPSQTDIAEANHGADFVYVIVSPVSEQVRAYSIDEGRVVELFVVDPNP